MIEMTCIRYGKACRKLKCECCCSWVGPELFRLPWWRFWNM